MRAVSFKGVQGGGVQFFSSFFFCVDDRGTFSPSTIVINPRNQPLQPTIAINRRNAINHIAINHRNQPSRSTIATKHRNQLSQRDQPLQSTIAISLEYHLCFTLFFDTIAWPWGHCPSWLHLHLFLKVSLLGWGILCSSSSSNGVQKKIVGLSPLLRHVSVINTIARFWCCCVLPYVQP